MDQIAGEIDAHSSFESFLRFVSLCLSSRFRSFGSDKFYELPGLVPGRFLSFPVLYNSKV